MACLKVNILTKELRNLGWHTSMFKGLSMLMPTSSLRIKPSAKTRIFHYLTFSLMKSEKGVGKKETAFLTRQEDKYRFYMIYL